MNDYESNYLTSARGSRPASPFCIQWIIECLGVLWSWKDVFSEEHFFLKWIVSIVINLWIYSIERLILIAISIILMYQYYAYVFQRMFKFQLTVCLCLEGHKMSSWIEGFENPKNIFPIRLGFFLPPATSIRGKEINMV